MDQDLQPEDQEHAANENNQQQADDEEDEEEIDDDDDDDDDEIWTSADEDSDDEDDDEGDDDEQNDGDDELIEQAATGSISLSSFVSLSSSASAAAKLAGLLGGDRSLLNELKFAKFVELIPRNHLEILKEQQQQQSTHHPTIMPTKRSGHRAICDENNVWIWGGFCPSSSREPTMPSLFEEFWNFNLTTKKWQKLETFGDIPRKPLASFSTFKFGNKMVVYGGTSFPFGTSLSNDLFILDLKSLIWKKLKFNGTPPVKSYGSSICYHKNSLYILFGTNSQEYFSHVYRVDVPEMTCELLFDPMSILEHADIRTRTWVEQKYPQNFLHGRYRQEVSVYDDKIYVFGGGTNTGDSCSLELLPVFDLKTNEWSFVETGADAESKAHPEKRKFHSCLKFEHDTFVYIIGGYQYGMEANVSKVLENCVWRLNLLDLKWQKLPIKMPLFTYFSASCLNESTGRVYVHGGVVAKSNHIRIDKLYALTLKIPILSELCWTKLADTYDMSSVDFKQFLRKFGLPNKFLERF